MFQGTVIMATHLTEPGRLTSLLVVNIEESSATLPEVKPGPIINPLTTVQVILESLLLPMSIGVGARWAKR